MTKPKTSQVLGRLVAVAALAGATALLPGCTSSQGGGKDGGTLKSSFCNLDSECEKGFKCDRELHQCVCTSDKSCPPSLFCNAFTGQCTSTLIGCAADSDCQDPTTQYCQVATHTCHTRKSYCESCTTDAECGTPADKCLLDSTLNEKFCGKACKTDADCANGSSCQTISGNKTCWPTVVTCRQIRGCNPDSGQTCTQNTDCTQGTDQICDKVQGSCVARVSTCPYGTVCGKDTSQCEAACTQDSDCNADPKCQNGPCRCTNSQCEPISVCSTDTDCPAGKVCVLPPGATTGECGAECTTDQDCPQGEVCSSIGSRSVCKAGCNTNADCPLSANCSAGQCVPGCQTTEVCDTCQVCKPINSQVNSCQGVGNTYCQACTAPAVQGSCNQAGTPPSPASWCCNMNGSTASTWGIDCSGTYSCPKGFECIAIGTVAHDCLPIGSACTAATCN